MNRSMIISRLQAGRAIAALVVVVHHAGQFARDSVGPIGAFADTLVSRGYLGVDFFFVLSGFIIYHTNVTKTGVPGWSRRYLESRLVRIFVPYLPVGIAVALGYTLLPGLSGVVRDWGWLASLTLLPTGEQPALIVAWTLQHELVFYAIFWLAFQTRRPFLVLAAWAAAMATAFPMIGTQPGFLLNPLVGLINIEFLFGIAVVWLLPKPLPNALFYALSATLFGFYFALGADVPHRILFAAAIAAALVPIVRSEQQGAPPVAGWIVFLGNASYAIYLVHNPFIALLARFAPMPPVVAIAWFFVAGTMAGIVYHIAFERPATKVARTQLARLRSRTASKMSSTT